LKYLEREEKMEAMFHPPKETRILVSRGTLRERQFEIIFRIGSSLYFTLHVPSLTHDLAIYQARLIAINFLSD